MAELKCLNPYDCQSKRIYDIDGVYRTLDAGNAAGGQAHGICYAIDQQGGKSNAGYAEDVMMTILSDSHGTPHGVCYALEGNGSRPSHEGGGVQREREDVHAEHDRTAQCVLSIEGHIVDRDTSQNGKGWAVGYAHTLNSTDRHAVCYGVDCRNATLDRERTHTIQAKPGGGVSANCTPSVLMEK